MRRRPQLRRITIALIGRPNVGKSSLFNRLVRSRLSIVNPTAGTTRDWKEAEGNMGDLEFTVMDTGGLDDAKALAARGALPEGAPRADNVAGVGLVAGQIEAKMLEHTERAIRFADVVLFMLDGRAGVTPDDERFARWIKARRPQGGVHVIANKTEGWLERAGEEERWEELEHRVFTLGFGPPVPMSAEHGEGMLALYDVLEPYAVVPEAHAADAEAEEQGRQGQQQRSGEGSGALEAARRAAPGQPTTSAASGGGGSSESFVGCSDGARRASGGVTAAEEEAGLLPAEGTAPRRRAIAARLARSAVDAPVHLAVVGRPNVGKSTLVNALLGEERALAGPLPGLTRDAVAVELRAGEHGERSVRLVDTAGMRRAGAWDLSTPLEGLAVGQARKALAMANVVLLVVDGSGGSAAGLTQERMTLDPLLHGDAAAAGSAAIAARAAGSGKARGEDAVARAAAAAAAAPPTGPRPRATRLPGLGGGVFGMTKQDLAIAEQILSEGRGLVVALNKIDAAPDAREVATLVRRQLDSTHEGAGAELVPISALRGGGVAAVLPAVLRTYDRWTRRIATGQLNAWLRAIQRHHPAPSVTRNVGTKGHGDDKRAISVPVPLRLKYVTQINARPPTFAVFANRRDVPAPYLRFLANNLRAEFDLRGVPLRILVRAAVNPFLKQGGRGGAAAHPRRRAAAAGRGRRPAVQDDQDEDGAAQRGSFDAGALAPAPASARGSPRGGSAASKPVSPEIARAIRAASLAGGRMRPFSRKERRAMATAFEKADKEKRRSRGRSASRSRRAEAER